MITGSIYLGKKAKKAYRKRQTEKLARQLVGPIEIVDPSEELTLTAPPVSHTEKTTSPSSIYSNVGRVCSADSQDRYQADSPSVLAPSSTYSSRGQHSALSEHSGNIAQFQERDLSKLSQLEPPSYDVALRSPPAENLAVTSYSQASYAPAGLLGNNEAQTGMGDGCPTCVALMHQHHLHGPLHVHGNAESLAGACAPGPQAMDRVYKSPTKHLAAIEMPGDMTGQRCPPDLGSLQISEMADTSRIAEMPAELPADMFAPIPEAKVGAGRDGDVSAGRTENFPVELPAE